VKQPPAVEYRVRILPEAHQLDVSLRIEGEAARRPLLATPTWIPGAYGFLKYGRDLFDVRASEPGGKALPLVREGWSGYRVESSGPVIEARYRACAADPAWAELCGYVGADQALLLGAHYLFPAGYRGPVRVRYELPRGWKLHHPSGPEPAGDAVFDYRSFSQLLDSPVVAGRFEDFTRRVEEADFHFVFLDRAIGFDQKVEALLDDIVKVVEQNRAIFGSFPFGDYTFVLSCDPRAKWGLEHATSSTCGFGEEVFIDPEAWYDAVRLCAHELLHAWNGCRLVPAPVGEPDLLAGSFPEALWVTEGFTRYYEMLLCVRSGAASPETLLGNVVNYHRQLTARPAYRRVAAVDSSRATFLNHNRFPGAANCAIDYYDQGMLLAFDLEAALRTGSPAHSLDEALRGLYERYAGKGQGLTHAQARDFFAELSAEAGERARRGTEEPAGLATIESLKRLGFEPQMAEQPFLGIVLAEGSEAEIADVIDESAAGTVGLAPGDEITGVGGHPFSLKALRWLVASRLKVELQVRRGGQTLTVRIRPGGRERIEKLIWRGDKQQEKLLSEMFGRPFAPEAGCEIDLSAHHNFHGIATMV
jgi:predicted metalloprotease with PDZ domain